MFASFSISHNIPRLSIGKLTRNRSEGAPNFVGSERDKRSMPDRSFNIWPVALRERTVRRREFIALLASAAAIPPLAARSERLPQPAPQVCIGLRQMSHRAIRLAAVR